MKCSHEGCGNKAALGRLNLCVKHRDERAEAGIQLRNQRGSAKKKAYRIANPPICRETGCDNPIEVSRAHRCNSCKAKRAAMYESGAMREKSAKQVEELADRRPPKPLPHKKPAKIMTDAQQRRIDAELAAKDRERLKSLGYGNGPVTIYRGAEAARVPVTPIHLIPRRDFGVRESGDAFQ